MMREPLPRAELELNKPRGGSGSGAKAAWVYVGLAYALSIALSVFIWLTGGHESRFMAVSYVSVFFPAAAVFVVSRTMNAPIGPLGGGKHSILYFLLALFLMPVVMHAAMLPISSALEGGLPWQTWLAHPLSGLYMTPASRGWGTITLQALIFRVVMNAFFGVAIVSFLAFFEEVGWRAWLLPRMAERFGARRAVVLVSLIWAFWHTPFALSGILHADGVSAPVMAFVHPVGTIGAGLIIGWLWLRTRSVWIASIAHGALNNWGQYAFKFMDLRQEGDGSIILLAGGLALAFVGSALLTFAVAPASGRTAAKA
jgi:membrane protease YdiL (CAAX protease family)